MTQTADATEMAIMQSGHNPFSTYTRNEGVTDGVYARFNGNEGKYICTGTELEAGSQVVMELFSCKICWLGFDGDNRPHMGPEVRIIDQKPLPEPDRSNKDIRWSKVVRVGMITMEGKTLVYTAKADKPGRAINRLINAYGKEFARQKTPTGYNVPVVELGVHDFIAEVPEKNPDGTIRKMKVKKYSEDFKIVSWISREEVMALMAAIPSDDDGEPEMKDVTPPAQEIIPPSAPAMPKAGSPFRRGATA